MLFAERIRQNADINKKGLDWDSSEPLSECDYTQELRLKYEALNGLLIENSIGIKADKIVPSPLTRNYRTTSKRKVVLKKEKLFLMLNEKMRTDEKALFVPSSLEPVEHANIFEFIVQKINEPAFKIAGKNLNFIIVRGNYREFSVIFNAFNLNGQIVRKFKMLGDHLRQFDKRIVSAFVYYDPSRSDYYLESERPEAGVNMKRLFGPEKLFVEYAGKKYSYLPDSFSQINQSAVDSMLFKAEELLSPGRGEYLFDLYCGYGLFTHHLTDKYRGCTGIELSGESIKSARENSLFMKHKSEPRFHAGKISPDYLQKILPKVKSEEVFLLDPPKQGTFPGVIDYIASRAPVKVLHIFCNTDLVAEELDVWLRAGYAASRIVPIDLFPGTPNLETLVLLQTAEKKR